MDENEICAQYERFVKFMLRRYFSKYQNDEDMFQEGMIGLLKAARTFDETKGVKFMTYAGVWIQWRILQILRDSRRRYIPTTSLDEIAFRVSDDSDIGNGLLLEDIYRLCKDQKDIEAVTLRYEGYTQREIGERIGLRETYVSRRLRKINAKRIELRDKDQ